METEEGTRRLRQFYLRELYFSATPVKPVTVEFGSFGIERGYGSEITTFDDDGYIAGERIAVHSPKQLFFDEIQFTNAYFGDFATTNFLDRGSSLKSSNYRQVSAKKKLNDRVAFSADYTWLTGTAYGSRPINASIRSTLRAASGPAALSHLFPSRAAPASRSRSTKSSGD